MALVKPLQHFSYLVDVDVYYEVCAVALYPHSRCENLNLGSRQSGRQAGQHHRRDGPTFTCQSVNL
jgi:hypothetical protein